MSKKFIDWEQRIRSRFTEEDMVDFIEWVQKKDWQYFDYMDKWANMVDNTLTNLTTSELLQLFLTHK